MIWPSSQHSPFGHFQTGRLRITHGLSLAVFILCGLAGVLAAPANADSLGAVCPDSLWMKLSRDSATGQEMVCGGTYPDKYLTWQSTAKPPATGFANLPVINGAAGSPCSAPSNTFVQSSDGYVVSCRRDGRAVLPGQRLVSVGEPVWGLYSP